MDINKRMFDTLEQRGLKYIDLANALNINKTVVSSWKKRGTPPPIEYAVRICELLGISINYLLGESDNENTGHTDITPAIAHNKKENELLKMFRKLDYEAQGDIFDIVKLKYEKSIKKATEKSSASVGANEGVNIA